MDSDGGGLIAASFRVAAFGVDVLVPFLSCFLQESQCFLLTHLEVQWHKKQCVTDKSRYVQHWIYYIHSFYNCFFILIQLNDVEHYNHQAPEKSAKCYTWLKISNLQDTDAHKVTRISLPPSLSLTPWCVCVCLSLSLSLFLSLSGAVVRPAALTDLSRRAFGAKTGWTQRTVSALRRSWRRGLAKLTGSQQKKEKKKKKKKKRGIFLGRLKNIF